MVDNTVLTDPNPHQPASLLASLDALKPLKEIERYV